MDSAIRHGQHGRLVIPDSARGRIGADAVSLEAAMQQEYIVIYGPFHALEMIRVTQEIAEQMQTVAESTGDDKTEARRILKDLVEERKDLVSRRDRATQRLVSAFDPKEAKRLFANAHFRNALLILRDPASVASAILAIHRARHGGNVSIFDTAGLGSGNWVRSRVRGYRGSVALIASWSVRRFGSSPGSHTAAFTGSGSGAWAATHSHLHRLGSGAWAATHSHLHRLGSGSSRCRCEDACCKS